MRRAWEFLNVPREITNLKEALVAALAITPAVWLVIVALTRLGVDVPR